MSDMQLYLSIGLPLFSLLLVFLANNRSIDALRSELKTSNDALRSELKTSNDALHEKIAVTTEALRNELKVNMESLRAEIRSSAQALHKRIDDSNDRLGRIERRLDVIDTEIRIGHDTRLAALEARVLGRAS